ncbi:MAG TPA: hypothetical protein ENK28_04925 [Aliiroseovarius sp.]|nr:hypothetical protein [Aliiroseovarius sp.]
MKYRYKHDPLAVPPARRFGADVGALADIVNPHWSPAEDKRVLDTQGRYGALVDLAAEKDMTADQVQQRWHRLRAVFRIREKLEAYIKIHGAAGSYPARDKDVSGFGGQTYG